MKLFSILSFVVLTLVEGIPLDAPDDFGGKEYRPARKMKRSKVDPAPQKVLLGYYLVPEAREKYKRYVYIIYVDFFLYEPSYDSFKANYSNIKYLYKPLVSCLISF